MSSSLEHPASPQVLDAAIEWQILLDSGEATNDEREAWQTWISAHPDHARVWRQLEILDSELLAIPPRQTAPVRDLLLKSHRRFPKAINSLAVLCLVIVFGLITTHLHQPLDGLLADHATGTGQQQQLILPDNTLLVLNSRTVVDIDFTDQQRRIRLRRGEVYVQSGHTEGEQRPLIVVTGEGSLQALGTGFVVQRQAKTTSLDVTEASVMARTPECEPIPTSPCPQQRRVEAGYGVQLTAGHISNPQASVSNVDAWRKGLLVIDNLPLSQVADMLARYRPGMITVAPEVADLHVTATLPITSSDLALRALTDALPIRLSRRTGWWIHLEARNNP